MNVRAASLDELLIRRFAPALTTAEATLVRYVRDLDTIRNKANIPANDYVRVQGDSGGPLLHQLANGRWVNIGIVSWGIRCGEPGRPGIYTRVNSYLDWIFENAVF